MFGFFVLNKPYKVTSRAAIDEVKKLVKPTKIGHTGTLDPLATGVLVVALGPATRLTPYVQSLRKTYIADFRFGVSSPSDDIETELVDVPSEPFDLATLRATVPQFVGKIRQRPPEYSAVKINGSRAYQLARKKKSFEIKPKTVTVDSIEVLSFSYPNCQLKICCGGGTYIRSIGRDLGRQLNSAAVMTGLCRHAVGDFRLERSTEVADLNYDRLEQKLIPPADLFSEHRIVLDSKQCADLANGKMYHEQELGLQHPSENLFAVDRLGQLQAVLIRHHSGYFKPAVNFAHYYR